MKRGSRRTRWSTAMVVAGALGIPAALANAQTQNALGVGVFAGASLPVGDFGNVGGTGWHAGGLIDWRSPLLPVGIRGDLAYHQFGSKEHFTPKFVVGTVNLVWNLPVNAESSLSPYVIGGGGFYNKHRSCTNCGNAVIASATKFGLNGGAGVLVPLSGFGSLIEARYHLIFDSQDGVSNSSVITLSAGIIFR
jgi:Outer membrane protein beta-barrel domain